MFDNRKSKECRVHEQKRYDKVKSSRMEFNSALAFVPREAKSKEENKHRRKLDEEKDVTPFKPKSQDTFEKEAKVVLGTNHKSKNGARLLASLIQKPSGPSKKQLLELKNAKRSATNAKTILHPNSWQLNNVERDSGSVVLNPSLGDGEDFVELCDSE